jgi:hypothetical protein
MCEALWVFIESHGRCGRLCRVIDCMELEVKETMDLG